MLGLESEHGFPAGLLTACVAGFCAAFGVLWLAAPWLLGRPFARASFGQRVDGVTRLVSTLHCAICLPLAVANCVDPAVAGDRVFGWHPVLSQLGVAITLGFFAYDALVIVALMTDPLSVKLGFLLHHGAAAYGLAAGLYTRELAFYGFVGFFVEVSTPLVNLRWLRRLCYGRDSRTTAIGVQLEVALIVVFFLCRLVLCPWMLYQLLLADWAHLQRAQPLVLYPVCACLVIITLLSTLWWFQLVRGFFARSAPGRPRQKAS